MHSITRTARITANQNVQARRLALLPPAQGSGTRRASLQPRSSPLKIIAPSPAAPTARLNGLTALHQSRHGLTFFRRHSPLLFEGERWLQTKQAVKNWGCLSARQTGVVKLLYDGTRKRHVRRSPCTGGSLFGAFLRRGLTRRRESEIEQNCRAILDELVLSGVAEEAAGSLCYATQKRMDIARALASAASRTAKSPNSANSCPAPRPPWGDDRADRASHGARHAPFHPLHRR